MSVVRSSSISDDVHLNSAYTWQILSQLPGNNRSRALNQLGGVQFAAPIRGVLPIGPNGVPGFDTLSPLQESDAHVLARSAAYNYTLGLQGIDTHLACHYDTQSPIALTEVLQGVFQVTGSCPNGIDALDNPKYFSILSNHTLGFWACGLGDRDPADNSFRSYNVYLRGFRHLNTTVANITCAIETKPAEYSVTFLKQSSAFITRLSSSQSTTGFPTHLIKQSVQAIGSVVSESQGFATNSLAETVLALGAKFFGLPLGTRDDNYPKLFEYMIQGIVEYQVGDHLKFCELGLICALCFQGDVYALDRNGAQQVTASSSVLPSPSPRQFDLPSGRLALQPTYDRSSDTAYPDQPGVVCSLVGGDAHWGQGSLSYGSYRFENVLALAHGRQPIHPESES